MHPKRLTLETGYDFMETKCVKKALKLAKKQPPSRVWVSIPCTAWSSVQNFNQKPGQRAALHKKRKKSVRLLRNVLKVLKRVVGPKRYVYFEWPTRCHGWRLPELCDFIQKCRDHGHDVQRVRIDGCMYGLMAKGHAEPEGLRLNKSWTVLTTDPTFSACGRRCDGGHRHRVIGGKDTCHSGFYPDDMGRAMTIDG